MSSWRAPLVAALVIAAFLVAVASLPTPAEVWASRPTPVRSEHK